MPKWYLYIVENSLGHYYTGISTDIKRRFNEHQSGGIKCAKALRGKSPLSLKYCMLLGGHSEALKAEIWVKKLSRQAKQKLINGKLEPDFEFQNIVPAKALSLQDQP